MSVSIKPWGQGLSQGWEWDGTVLKPWGRGLSDGWEWDGKNLKPWGKGLSEGWEWDGKVLKPWGRGLSDGWEWDGKNLKPWGKCLSDGWEWDGKILKPWGKGYNCGYEVNGAIPIPVMALLIANSNPTVGNADLETNSFQSHTDSYRSDHVSREPRSSHDSLNIWSILGKVALAILKAFLKVK
jgi:hypothetical protein